MKGYKTFAGLLVAAVPQIASLLGFDVASGFSEQATDLIDAGITLVGLGIAFYGRLVATVPGWFAKN